MSSFIYKFEFAKNVVASQCCAVNRLMDDRRTIEAMMRATRLWNYIDCCEDPEYLWAIMASGCDYLFENDQDFNSMQFVYCNIRIRFAGDDTIYDRECSSARNAAWWLAKIHNKNPEDALYWRTRTKRWESVAMTVSSRQCRLIGR